MTAYYNENDPYVAQWLRNLISAGHIAPGDVDERSIVDVRGSDLVGYTQCHFFAGIGGWSLALRLAGWPDDRPVWTGSCPCQPFSAAGAGKAANDERHLWPAWFPLIAKCRPAIVFGEQVEAAIGWGWLDVVFADLEAEGYACGAAVLPACSVGAPHIRQRCWFVANNSEPRREPWRGPSQESQGGNATRLELGRLRSARELADASDSGRKSVTRIGGLSGPEAARVAVPELGIDGNAGDSVRLGYASSAGLQERERNERIQQEALGSRAGQATLGGSDPGNVEHANGARSPARGSAATTNRHGSTALATGWDACDWLPCTDGKARPVEPGTFPLASGISGRVGRLRAYGNAIVPQVAAEFIRAADLSSELLRESPVHS